MKLEYEICIRNVSSVIKSIYVFLCAPMSRVVDYTLYYQLNKKY